MVVPIEDIHAPEIRSGVYRHYKGDLMEVIGVSLHSETLEPFVTYRHITGEHKEERHFWVRPYEMFLEEVRIEGRSVPRFEFIKDKP